MFVESSIALGGHGVGSIHVEMMVIGESTGTPHMAIARSIRGLQHGMIGNILIERLFIPEKSRVAVLVAIGGDSGHLRQERVEGRHVHGWQLLVVLCGRNSGFCTLADRHFRVLLLTLFRGNLRVLDLRGRDSILRVVVVESGSVLNGVGLGIVFECIGSKLALEQYSNVRILSRAVH